MELIPRYAVTWIEEDGGETRVCLCVERSKAEQMYEKCKTSPRRQGRGVALATNYYERVHGLLEFSHSEMIEAEGCESWKKPDPIRAAASALGRLGGSKRSAAKTAAVRLNAQKRRPNRRKPRPESAAPSE